MGREAAPRVKRQPLGERGRERLDGDRVGRTEAEMQYRVFPNEGVQVEGWLNVRIHHEPTSYGRRNILAFKVETRERFAVVRIRQLASTAQRRIGGGRKKPAKCFARPLLRRWLRERGYWPTRYGHAGASRRGWERARYLLAHIKDFQGRPFLPVRAPVARSYCAVISEYSYVRATSSGLPSASA